MCDESYKDDVNSFISNEVDKWDNIDLDKKDIDMWENTTPENFAELKERIPEFIEQVIMSDENQAIYECIDAISIYLHSPNIQIGESFEKIELAMKFADLLRNEDDSPSVEKIKILILTCIKTLWYYNDDDSVSDSVWLMNEVVDSVLYVLKHPDRSVVPVAYLALANYAVISVEKTLYLLQNNIHETLLNFLRAWTSPCHTKPGLKLALNMLKFRNEDVYEAMMDFIPCFRCHIMNMDAFIRNQACVCLVKLCEYEPAVEECIKCEVPNILYASITDHPEYFVSSEFNLIHIFLKSPCRRDMLTEKLIQSFDQILELSMKEKSKEELSIERIFTVLLEIEEDMRQFLIKYNIYQKACIFIQNGYTDLKLNAAVFLAVGLESVQKNVKDDLLYSNNAVECLCSVVPLLTNENKQRIIFSTLYTIIHSKYDDFCGLFIESGVLDDIESLEDDLSPQIREITDGILSLFTSNND